MVVTVEQLEPDGDASGVVEQPDPVAGRHRRDVQVDFVDESPLEELPADRGREDLRVPAVDGLQPDPDRFGHVAAQESHATGGPRVLPGDG